jgi:hypothetical protein
LAFFFAKLFCRRASSLPKVHLLHPFLKTYRQGTQARPERTFLTTSINLSDWHAVIHSAKETGQFGGERSHPLPRTSPF